MRLAVLAIALATSLPAQTICGKRTSEADVYCIPDMRPFGTMFNGPQVQLWVRYDHPLSQTFFVRLEYRYGVFPVVVYRLMDGRNGLAAISIDVLELSPTRIDYWDAKRWYWRQITP